MLVVSLFFCLFTLVASIEFVDTVTVQEDGSWELDFSFTPDASLPIGTASFCHGAAPDSMLYLQWRAFFHTMSPETVAATGFQFAECDWNPCGHPTLAHFGKPHWDCHFFYTSYEYQQSLLGCETPPNAPICTPPPYVQSTEEGRGYFDYGDAVNNMPLHFTVDAEAAIPGSGVHWYDQRDLANVAEWVEPVLIMGSYGGQMNFFEPMIPFDFQAAPVENNYCHNDIEYNALNNLDYLPTDYCVHSPAEDHSLAIKISGAKQPEQPCGGVCGQNAVCNEETDMCELDCPASHACCKFNDMPSCGGSETDSYPACVCKIDPWCCDANGHWDNQCIEEARSLCGMPC